MTKHKCLRPFKLSPIPKQWPWLGDALPQLSAATGGRNFPASISGTANHTSKDDNKQQTTRRTAPGALI